MSDLPNSSVFQDALKAVHWPNHLWHYIRIIALEINRAVWL